VIRKKAGKSKPEPHCNFLGRPAFALSLVGFLLLMPKENSKLSFSKAENVMPRMNFRITGLSFEQAGRKLAAAKSPEPQKPATKRKKR